MPALTFKTFAAHMSELQKPPRENNRVKLSPEQTKILNEYYAFNSRPGNSERQYLSDQLGVNVDKIKNWFQNRRAKDKKDTLEHRILPRPVPHANKAFHPDIFPNCSDLFRRRL